MREQKKASITLSLHQEIEREARQIEEEMAKHPELDQIVVTEEMDKAFLEKIRAYEKEKEANRRSAKEAGEDLPESRNESADETDTDGLAEAGNKSVRNTPGGTGVAGNTDGSKYDVEFSDELMPDLNPEMISRSGKAHEPGPAEEDEKGKAVYRRKKRKYLIVSLVAVLVIVLGVGMNSVGSKSYLKVFWNKIHGGEPMKVINVEDMNQQQSEDGDETAAYLEIENKLHIKPVRLIYKPDEMEIKKYEIFEEMLTAQLLYKYKDDVIRYTLYVNSSDSSWGEKEEDYKIDEYTIIVNDVEIKIEEFQVPNLSENKQVANFEYQGVDYQLVGAMKKATFQKILENLYFF